MNLSLCNHLSNVCPKICSIITIFSVGPSNFPKTYAKLGIYFTISLITLVPIKASWIFSCCFIISVVDLIIKENPANVYFCTNTVLALLENTKDPSVATSVNVDSLFTILIIHSNPFRIPKDLACLGMIPILAIVLSVGG